MRSARFFLVCWASCANTAAMSTDERLQWRASVKEMFYVRARSGPCARAQRARRPPPSTSIFLPRTRASLAQHVYDGYKQYAFPHYELRPLSRTHTDSLVELGAASPTRAGYSGVALTLIDSLDTLAILGNASEFAWAVRWIGENVSFDLDVEVRITASAPHLAARTSDRTHRAGTAGHTRGC